MAWYHEAVFYHIYPLGLSGAPKQNRYVEPVHRLKDLLPWISHIRSLGFTALYIGPLFESVGHGYETTDYRRMDSRLGTNQDLRDFVAACHDAGIRVVLDAVFNHTGRDFFAFREVREKREQSPYQWWYCNVNFQGNNSFNDGFSYDTWGGYDLLAKLNLHHPDVRAYHLDTVRFWVNEFDIDGLRLDTADLLDFDFLRELRSLADQIKPDFWLMGEVIHGEYNRWVNDSLLHSVTDYALNKALWSGHNDRNYFEIAHTVQRSLRMLGGQTNNLYMFADNHDVERVFTRLTEKAHLTPLYILLFTLPGIPSVYYGSEFAIEGIKQRGGSDDAIRPALKLAELQPNACTELIGTLAAVRSHSSALAYGGYRELLLRNRQYAYTREAGDEEVIAAVNCDDAPAEFILRANRPDYMDVLSAHKIETRDGFVRFTLPPASGVVLWSAAENIS